MRRIILVIGLAVGVCLLSGMSLFRGGQSYLRSFEGKVVDAETKEPIEGAAVLAVYYQEVPSIVAGSNHYAVDAQETLTDINGEFKIPAKTVKLEDVSWKPECNLTIFKPGYGVFPGHKLSNAVGENKSWPPPEKYIVYEIPKLKTREEREKNLPIRPLIKKSKYIVFLNLINEEREYLGFDKIPLKGGIEDVR
jgi:hypothetical protein